MLQDVRHFEEFTQLILGMLPETKRKSLPRVERRYSSLSGVLGSSRTRTPVAC
jgi:hypothetical protein